MRDKQQNICNKNSEKSDNNVNAACVINSLVLSMKQNLQLSSSNNKVMPSTSRSDLSCKENRYSPYKKSSDTKHRSKNSKNVSVERKEKTTSAYEELQKFLKEGRLINEAVRRILSAQLEQQLSSSDDSSDAQQSPSRHDSNIGSSHSSLSNSNS